MGGTLRREDIVYSEGMENLRNSANTDGLIVKLHGNEDEVREICKEWETRTGMTLGYDKITKVVQADVNSYIAVFENGKIEAKGGYVKDLNTLDYDLSIVNASIRNYLLYGTKVEDTVLAGKSLREFQKVYKLSSKYKTVHHNGKVYTDKCFRVFASKNDADTYLGKSKGDGCTIEKFAGCPEHCRIVNSDIRESDVPDWLDKNWYINEAKKRLRDKFGVMI